MASTQFAPLKKTPEWSRKMFRIFFLVTSITAFALQNLPENAIPESANAIINKWVLWGNTVMWFISRSFGVDTETTTSITESVTKSITHETTVGKDEKELPAKPEEK